MGTNFYWKVPKPQPITLPTGEEYHFSVNTDRPSIHIGKRSAAGLYCWDCDVTLCAAGNEGIHFSRSHWYDACPRCGKTREEERHLGSAGVELGFKQPDDTRPKGVHSCASFNWAQDPEIVGPICREHPDDPLIEDEYGREITGGQFLKMLECNCPIQFTDMVGGVFC